ncbi:MFS transporter [Rhodococcus sp. 1168]|uniref:MFS transporter n=1 Tax=Rhodococcus sp. 1168 TaxID=2018041 RepID=UPI000A0CE0C3|nr:MFS transporter [Rhodococcus sp. 1168]ORI19330.1 MFS transporter [Rhodococcus sp. 1168]
MTTVDRHTAPARAGLVLFVLILVASVANLNLAVANVALPAIGRDFDASQTQLNLIAVAYSLGLAGSVLYLGALGDRYGRKLLLVLGMVLSIPACVIAGFAPNFEVLFGARLLGGLSAGLAYPTTLALITALWSGASRTKAIALWSALGGAMSALGPLMSGALLEKFQWGSVFLVTSPLALVALVLAAAFVPAHVNETTDPVDNLGGIVSVVFIAALVLSINFAPVDGMGTVALGLGAIALAAGAVFLFRQSRTSFPLFDLKIARRRTFWVAALAGIIVFGSLMGVIFVGQQFLQNVLGYSTLAAGASTLPAAVAMVLVAPQSAKLVERRGSRFTLLLGYVFIVLGLVMAWLTWKEDVSYAVVAISYVLLGVGVGLAGTPASRSLTGSVPVDRAGMASGTADLQRDLGGAIMQSTLGALLTAGYAASLTSQISSSPEASSISEETQSILTKSFSSATDLASTYPQYADQIIGAAKQAFLDGDQMSYAAAIVVVLVGAVLVFFAFPGRDEERKLLAQYHSIDVDRSATPIDESG